MERTSEKKQMLQCQNSLQKHVIFVKLLSCAFDYKLRHSTLCVVLKYDLLKYARRKRHPTTYRTFPQIRIYMKYIKAKNVEELILKHTEHYSKTSNKEMVLPKILTRSFTAPRTVPWAHTSSFGWLAAIIGIFFCVILKQTCK